ncbi:MAG: DNA-directed RNA polymerase subunit K [Candidatus Bathyarchaeales archaeon]
MLSPQVKRRCHQLRRRDLQKPAAWAEWKAWESTNITTLEKESKIKIGPPKLTRFERARIVGARALQIAMGAPILVEPSTKFSSPIDIGLEELKNGILPITIRRTLPDGTYQDVPLKWLLQTNP